MRLYTTKPFEQWTKADAREYISDLEGKMDYVPGIEVPAWFHDYVKHSIGQGAYAGLSPDDCDAKFEAMQ